VGLGELTAAVNGSSSPSSSSIAPHASKTSSPSSSGSGEWTGGAGRSDIDLFKG
jgi:hypothetical protein